MSTEQNLLTYYIHQEATHVENEDDRHYTVHVKKANMLTNYQHQLTFTRMHEWEKGIDYPVNVLRHAHDPEGTDDYLVFTTVHGQKYAFDLMIYEEKSRVYVRYYGFSGGVRHISRGDFLDSVRDKVINYLANESKYRLYFATGEVEIV